MDRRAGVAGALLRDPWLLAIAGYAVLVGAFFLSGLGDEELRIRMAWLAQVPADITLAVGSWLVRSAPGITAPARRFWTTVAGGVVAIATGDIIHTVETVRHPEPAQLDGSTVQVVCFMLAVSAITVVMLTFSSGVSRGREHLRWWLDLVTVLIGGGVLAWFLAFDQNVTADSPLGTAGLTTMLAGAAVTLVTIFAGLRMMLSRTAPITQLAATPMLAAMALQFVTALLTPATAGGDSSRGSYLVRVMPAILAMAGPVIQRRQALLNPFVFARGVDKRFSAMPYIAVTFTAGALIIALPSNAGIQVWGVVAGTIGTISLVVARQLLALRELREQEGRLVEQAAHDGLTKLLNRTGLAERVAAALSAGKAPSVALLMIDLDDFKNINDTLGHAVGDALLVAVAARLRGAVPPLDVVARLGGDEFAVLLHDVDGPAGVDAVGRRILDDVCTPVVIGEQTLLVRASIGAAVAGPGDDLASMLRNADIALYEGKDRGKGTVVRYAPEMRTRLLETAEIGAKLRDAIGAGEMRLVYQPIVQMDDGQVVGTEALVRWFRPDGAMVSPADFIPVAERTGLVVPLGRWVLEEACRQAAAWLREYGSAAPASMNVNVAGRQLQEPGFVDEVAAALAAADLPAGRLTIEVTENAALTGKEVLTTLHELRALGVRLALDDFGTAASSLGLLLTCPVTSLKLDRSFVESITTVNRQVAVATAVVQIAQALDLDVVAEGIETPEQAAVLRRLGYRRAQGFLYYRPQPPENLTPVWEARAARSVDVAR